MINPFDDHELHIKAKVAVVYGFLTAANILAWVCAWSAFCNRPALLGTAFLAYMLGLRHAFDADHIAAIDNVVRSLMREGKKPFSVGFFFSFGHSSIVVVGSIAIAATATAVHSHSEALRDFGGITGTTASALFLLAIGTANLFILKSIWAAFSRARCGETIVQEDMNILLARRGVMARLFRRAFHFVSRSWQMYPIGLLFGLGFDTATEIGLLGISAMPATQGMSLWTILIFPALFTAGMSLMDTTGSALMSAAYGWVLINPIRKLWYNFTITAASVAVAIFIGGIEALGLIFDKLGPQGAFWKVAGSFIHNIGNAGFAVVAIFVASCAISVVIYRIRGFDRLQTDIA